MLALPKPPFAPYSPMIEKINKKDFAVQSGDFYVTPVGMAQFMSGLPWPDKITEFSFDFGPDKAVFNYTSGSEKKSLDICLDGGRLENKLVDGVASRALLSGAWVAENKFELRNRFIETCSETKRTFVFEGDTVRIESGEKMMFLQKEEEPVVAGLK